MNLRSTFDCLPRPSAEGCFAVEATSERFRVARSFEGFPALLIAFDEASAESLPRRLANLGYSPPKDVELVGSVGRHSERLAVLECRTTDPALIDYFFRIVVGTMLSAPDASTASGFEAALDAIVALFRSLQQPASRTVQGLWAELAVIAWAAKPAVALVAWHSGPRALHDFASGMNRLEVKGSSTGLREHNFKLDQLRSVDGGNTLVASLLLDESATGANVFDLAESIESALPGIEQRRRLQAVVASSLGAGWSEAGALRFDLELARQRLRLFRAEDVPSIPEPLPAEVKEVAFTVDLSTSAALELATARETDAFYRDVLPRS